MSSARHGMVCALALAALLAAAGAASSGQATRSVEVRVTDHRPGIADFKRLAVGFAGIAIHEKGAARNQGWVDLVGATPDVDIVPLKDGRFETVATGGIPAARYDALRIRFTKPSGELHAGKTPPLEARDTTVAIAIDARDRGRIALTIDLFAEDLTDHTPRKYAVKVKEVRVDRVTPTARGSQAIGIRRN